VFEIVNHNKNPVLQVIYKSADEVQVNGIIFGSKYDFAATYDGKRPAWYFGSSEPMQIVENQTTQTVTLAEAQRRMSNMDLFLDAHAAYDQLSTNQKAIFKYPSNLFPGEFAASDNPPVQSGFKIELLIAWSVIGFGVLWMCFGWIFFQKRI
jgi:hypothetical protein